MIIQNATILTFNEKNEVIYGGGLLIKDGVIKGVKKNAERQSWKMEERKASPPRINASGKIVMPGLINLHMHLYSTFARGILLKRAPENFLEILRQLWWKLDRAMGEEDVYYSALFTLIQAIKGGVTTIFDHHASPNFISGSLDVLAEAFSSAGLRGCLCFEVSDRYGKSKTEQSIQENLRFMEKMKGTQGEKNKTGRTLTSKFGLHASFTLSQKTLARCRELTDETSAEFGFHIHCAEDKADLKDALKKYGRGVVERLYESGILGPATIAAHCVHLREREIKLLARSKTAVAHNPRSNMNNAVGIAPVIKMAKSGVRLGLGTDGISPKVQDDFLLTPLLQKIANADPRVGAEEAFKALFRTNSEVASETFGLKLGKIAEGAAADLIIVNYFTPTPITAENLLGHLFFGLFDAPVSTTIVNGKVIMREGKLLSINEEEISAQAQKLAHRLWSRFT